MRVSSQAAFTSGEFALLRLQAEDYAFVFTADRARSSFDLFISDVFPEHTCKRKVG